MVGLRTIRVTFEGKSFETQVILLTAMLGVLRMVVALYLDTTRQQLNYLEIVTDSILFLTFCGLLVLGLKSANIRSVHPIYGWLLIFVLALNFVEFGGVEAEARFNYYSGIYIIILLYVGLRLYLFLIVQFLLAAVICWSIYHQYEWVNSFTVSIEATPLDFIFALVALGFLSYYLKSITLREINSVERLNTKLQETVEEEIRVNGELIEQGKALQAAQERLEDEVQKRTFDLEQNQMAIEAFIHVNTSVLSEPIQKLQHIIQRVPADDQLQTLLKISGEELQSVYNRVKHTLESEEDLHRTKVRPQ